MLSTRLAGQRSARRSSRALLLATAVLGAGFATQAANAAVLGWDPGNNPAAPTGGAGAWDTVTANWSNGASDQAWAASSTDEAVLGGASGTVTIATGGVSANIVDFNVNGYAVGGDVLTMAGTTPTINVNNASSATLNSIVAGSAGVAVAGNGVGGNGTLVLTAANTFTGGLAINSGAQVNYANTSALGASAGGVTLNGGTLSYTAGANYNNSRVLTFAAPSTLNVATAGGAGGKIVFNTTNALTGSGTITKSGPGWITIYNAQNASGGWNVNGGVVEVGSNTGLGTGAVTINGDGTTNASNSGEIAANGKTLANAMTLNGGIMGADGGTGTYTGAVNVAANSNIRLGDFWGAGGRNVVISGAVSGAGNLSLINGLTSTPSGQVLTLSGNNTGYTGTLTVDPGHQVVMSTANSVPAHLVAVSSASAIPTIGIGFDAAPPTVDTTNAATGVFTYQGSAFTQALDQSAVYGGGWLLGTTNGGSFWSSTFKPGNGNTYRVGGGGGSLYIGNPVLNDYNGGGTKLVLGDSRINGGGTIQIANVARYTGSTTLVNGTLTMNGGSLQNSNIAIGTGTTLNANATNKGTLNYNLAGDISDLITVATGGKLDITNLKLIIDATGSQTLGNYMIAQLAAGSTLTGSAFASVSYLNGAPYSGTASALPAGWSVAYTAPTSTTAGSIMLTAPIVPEPASLGLLSLGSLAFLSRRRRA